MSDSNEAPAPTRDANGRLLPGCTANPEGNNGQKKGWQPYGERLQKWLARPAQEIKDLIDDREKLGALSSIDVACVRHVVGMLFGKETLKYLEAGLDRIEGKAKQTIKHTGAGQGDDPVVFTLMIGEKTIKED